MRFSNWTLTRLCLAGGMLLSAAASQAVAQNDVVGVARIAKARKAPAVRGSVEQTNFADWMEDAADGAKGMSESLSRPAARIEEVQAQTVGYRRPKQDDGQVIATVPAGEDTATHPEDCKCKLCKKCRKMDRKLAKDQKPFFGTCSGPWCTGHSGHDMCTYFHSKFGYFCPSGNGGPGSPFFGCYSRVYPQDVGYADGRDAQLYAAQGYGIPMAVPLAPTVGHTYNYGWGVPSSRLTPISNLAPR
jgi:hypothetical protein